MLHASVHANKTHASPASPNVAPRRCACGGLIGPDGECAACRAKRLGKPLQTRLLLNRPGDAHEQAAVQTAARAMRASAGSPIPLAPLMSGPVGDAAAPPSVAQTLTQSGHPLDPGTRVWMEHRFGADFGGVRVHRDAQAAASAREIGAAAYTVGRDVVFGAGHYAPHTSAGQHLIAHELAHVVQQRGGSGGMVQRQTTEAEIRQAIAENEARLAASGLSQEEVLRLGQERNRLLAELQAVTSRTQSTSSPAPVSRPAASNPLLAPLDPTLVQRPPGLPLNQGFQLAQATDMPPDLANNIPEGQLVTVTLPQTSRAATGGPAVPGPVVALAELGGGAAGGAEASLLVSQVARPGGLLGSASPFARVPTAAEEALIRAGRAFHFTPAQNLSLIQQSGGTVLLRPSAGLYRNLLTPGFEPSAYAFLGQPSGAQAAANLAGRGSLAQQGLVIIEGADLPPGTLYRPLDRTIVVPRGYQGPGAVVEPGGQLPLPLRSAGAASTEAGALEGAAAQGLTRFQVLRWGGRFFIVVGIVATGYEIASAPPAERARTAVGATSGFVGGLAAGAAAGLLCGPGAPLCSVVLGLTFGIAGGLASRAAAEGIYDIATGR